MQISFKFYLKRQKKEDAREKIHFFINPFKLLFLIQSWIVNNSQEQQPIKSLCVYVYASQKRKYFE